MKKYFIIAIVAIGDISLMATTVYSLNYNEANNHHAYKAKETRNCPYYNEAKETHDYPNWEGNTTNNHHGYSESHYGRHNRHHHN